MHKYFISSVLLVTFASFGAQAQTTPAPAAAEPAVTNPSPPPAPPAKLAVGSNGYFQPTLLLQGWYVDDHFSSPNTDTNTFRIRRAELGVKGEIVPGLIAYALVLDPAKLLEFSSVTTKLTNATATDTTKPATVSTLQPGGTVTILNDFFITFKSEYVDASLGQFKIPVSWEGYNSSSKLLFAERALVSKQFGDKRDIGLRLAKTTKFYGYSAGLFNGNSSNRLDNDKAKDGALRLELYPIDGLTIAGMAYGTLMNRDLPGAKDRFEGDLRFEYAGFLFQGEFIRGEDRGATAISTSQGYYGAVAYMLTNELQAAVRVGRLDPHTNTPGTAASAYSADQVWHYEGGLNYYFSKNEAKAQLDYAHFKYDHRGTVDEVILAAQVAY